MHDPLLCGGFCWLVVVGKILIVDILRGISSDSISDICVLSGDEREL